MINQMRIKMQEIIYNKEFLKSNLCDNYSDAYILVRGSIIFKGHKQHLKMVCHLLNVLQKLIDQQ